MTNFNRRRFLERGAVTSVTAATGSSLANTLSRAAEVKKVGPNDRIQVGCVGVGGRASSLLKFFSGQKDVDVVVLADIDSRKLPGAAELVKQQNQHRPETTGDFRRLVDNPKIDVLVVGTPDHWHAIPTILGCLAGKDVYVEKPDGHNMVEGQRMVAAMKKHQRIVQLGTQSRTSTHFRTAIDYIRSGKLGRVLVAKAWESTRQGSIGNPPDSSPPRGVDYDMWLGAAPKRPFNVRRFHGNWRWFFDYGTGDLGNDGVHRIDVARWALSEAVRTEGETLPALPATISALGGKWYFDDMQQWPDTLQVNYQYSLGEDKPGRILTYEMRVWAPYNYQDEGEGVALYGDQGYIIIGNRRWRAFAARHKLVAEDTGEYDGESHVRNFLDCVRSRQRPNADLETVGHPSSVHCHAANIAWRVGRQLVLDPKTETFVGDEQANALRSRGEYRKPWILPEV